MEDDQNGRQPKWKTTKLENAKMEITKMKNYQNGGPSDPKI